MSRKRRFSLSSSEKHGTLAIDMIRKLAACEDAYSNSVRAIAESSSEAALDRPSPARDALIGILDSLAHLSSLHSQLAAQLQHSILRSATQSAHTAKTDGGEGLYATLAVTAAAVESASVAATNVTGRMVKAVDAAKAGGQLPPSRGDSPGRGRGRRSSFDVTALRKKSTARKRRFSFKSHRGDDGVASMSLPIEAIPEVDLHAPNKPKHRRRAKSLSVHVTKPLPACPEDLPVVFLQSSDDDDD